jgi:hypothetical protein
MARIDLASARTSAQDPAQAAEELMTQLGSAKPKLVTMFASSDRDQLALNRALRARLHRDTRLVGATSGGEIDNTGIHHGSVVIAALSGDLEIGIGVGRNLSSDAVAAGAAATAGASNELGVRPQDLDPRNHVGMVIDDGFQFKKEELLLGMLDRNPALIVVGGGAATREGEPTKHRAMVHIDGEVVSDAVLLTMVRTTASWAALRSHWYEATGQRVRITRTDETCTRALEIDGLPAAQRYADLLGVSIDDLEFGKPNGFARRPTALKVGREYFIRAPWKPLEDGSILFANLLDEGTELELMQLGDMAGATRQFFTDELPRRVPAPTAALLFHCLARDWYARAMGAIDDLSAAFAHAPSSAGMNVYFETYAGFQINTTLTVLAFGENDA